MNNLDFLDFWAEIVTNRNDSLAYTSICQTNTQMSNIDQMVYQVTSRANKLHN